MLLLELSRYGLSKLNLGLVSLKIAIYNLNLFCDFISNLILSDLTVM